MAYNILRYLFPSSSSSPLIIWALRIMIPLYLHRWMNGLPLFNTMSLTACYRNKGVVSKETVVLRRWGGSIQKFGFINGVDKCKLATVQRF